VWFRNEQFRNLSFTQEELSQNLVSSARTIRSTHTKTFEKKIRISRHYRSLDVRLVSSMLLVALSTVDRFTRRRHKRYLRICTALRAFDLRHLPRGPVTSILITHFIFHRPNFLVIRKIILAAIIGTGLTALPSFTQVRSPVYRERKRRDDYKR